MALGDVIARLSVTLGLDSAAFEKGAARASKETDVLGNRMEAMGRRVGLASKALAAAGLAVAGSAVIGAIKNLVDQGLEYASALGEQAAALGVTTDALQEYRYAATQVGLSSEEMDTALGKLTKSIGQAITGSKAQVEAFNRLGVSLKDTKGNVLDAGAAIPLIADGLKKISSPAERATLETTLFGKAGQKLETLLAGGSAGVNELRDAAHRLGIVLSEKQIQDADATADKIGDVKRVLEARIAGVVADNAKSIYMLVDALASLADKAIKAGAAWAKFMNTTSVRDLAIRNANASISARTDRTAAQKRAAYELVPGAVDRRMGIKTESVGGFWGALGLKRTTYANQPSAPAAARAADPKLGDAVALTSGSPKTPKTPKGPSGPSAAETAKRYNDQLFGITQQILSARQSMSDTAQEEAELALRQVEWDRIKNKQEITADKDYSAAQKADLLQANERLADAQREGVDRDQRRRVADEAAETDRQAYDAAREALQFRASLADTEGERSRLALDQLTLDQQYRRQSLERIIHSDTRTQAERDLAQLALDQLNANSTLERASVMRGNETATQTYVRGLSQTPAQINEAFDQIKLDGLDSLNEGLVQAVTRVKSLGSVFKDVAAGIIADLARIAIRQAIMKPLAGLLGLGGGISAGTVARLTPSAASTISANISGAFAKGTNYAPRGVALVGENGPELVKMRGGEQVIPNNKLGGLGGMSKVQIIPSPYFQVVVDGRIQRAAPTIVGASVAESGQRTARSQSRRVG